MTGPRVPLLTRKPVPTPGLTGADLEQAKAEAALAAANKMHQTATHDLDASVNPGQSVWDRWTGSANQGADAAANLKNIAYAQDPDAENRLLSALAALRARLGGR